MEAASEIESSQIVGLAASDETPLGDGVVASAQAGEAESFDQAGVSQEEEEEDSWGAFGAEGSAGEARDVEDDWGDFDGEQDGANPSSPIAEGDWGAFDEMPSSLPDGNQSAGNTVEEQLDDWGEFEDAAPSPVPVSPHIKSSFSLWVAEQAEELSQMQDLGQFRCSLNKVQFVFLVVASSFALCSAVTKGSVFTVKNIGRGR